MSVGGDVGVNAAERRRWNDEAWTSSWPRRELLTDQVTPLLLTGLALHPGEAVLDVGCGGGRTTLAAAQLVGVEGAVVGADISEPLLALAERRRGDAGDANVSFVLADMQVDRVGAGHFDVVMSQFGVMFFDDPVAAFTNIGRQLRAGGRIGFACWQPLGRNPWHPASVLAEYLAPPPAPAPGRSATGPFTLGDPDRVAGLLGAAAFSQVACARHELVVEVPLDAVVDDAQLANFGLAGSAMDQARAAVTAHLEQFRQPGGRYRFPVAFQIVTARRG